MQGCAWVLRHDTKCPFIGTELECMGCKPKEWKQLELPFGRLYGWG